MNGNIYIYICIIPMPCCTDRLVLETDAPALGPDKSTINVPENIVVSCRWGENDKLVDFTTISIA
jgi:Tat protein secretion system quality control protein TatD with DNase activity